MLPNQITRSQAVELVTRFRNNPGPDMPYAETFFGDSVKALLAQAGCENFRVYLGRKANDSICLILVGVDADGNDILPPTNSRPISEKEEDEGIILEDAIQCPPVCPPSSLLNE
ncbi:MAG TPA: hypothetical protein VG842_13060 [Sediminibacterium sp.]|nr:hypothetical protein [Sediminibacterium sp.]